MCLVWVGAGTLNLKAATAFLDGFPASSATTAKLREVDDGLPVARTAPVSAEIRTPGISFSREYEMRALSSLSASVALTLKISISARLSLSEIQCRF